MHKKTQLAIFTLEFPYKNHEQFLEEEVNISSKFFEEIVFFPPNDPKTINIQKISLNSKVFRLADRFPEVDKRKANDYLFVFGIFMSEFFKTFNFRLFNNFRYHISELFVYLANTKIIASHCLRNYFLKKYW